MLHALHCWIILIFFYAYALNFINRCIWSLFWLLGVPIGSQFHKKFGPYFKAWGSLLVSGLVLFDCVKKSVVLWIRAEILLSQDIASLDSCAGPF